VLNVHRFGPADGPPVLALHGVTGHGRRWRRFAEGGLPGRQVFAPDLRGHGQSTWLPPWTVERHVADLVELLDGLGLQAVAVVGHSMGGLVALHLAVTVPERVSRLVLLDPMVDVGGADAFESAEWMRIDNGWGSEEEARAARREGHVESAFPAIEDDLADVGSADGDGRFRLRFCRSAAVCGWSEMARPVPELTGHAVPTLVVIADGDPYDKKPLLAALADAPGPVTVERLAAGHMLYWDAFEETAALVGGFVA
jgi:lipase